MTARGFDPDAPITDLPASGRHPGVYRRIAAYMGEFRGGIAGTVALMMAGSVFVALQPWAIKLLIDGVLVNNRLDLGPLGTWVGRTDAERMWHAAILAAGYLGLTAAAAMFGAAAYYVLARTALSMIHGLRTRLVGHLRSLSLRFHTNRSLGDTIWRAINDARSIQEVMIFGVRTWGELAFRLILMIVLMLLLDPLLTAVAVATVPLLVFAIQRYTGRIQDASRISRTRMSALTAHIEQTMGAIRAVQVFGRERAERERLATASLAFVDAQLRFRRAEQTLNAITIVLTGLGTAAVLLVAAQRVQSGAVTIGSLWVYVAYMQGLYQMMNQIMFVYGPFQDAVIGVGRVFEALDQTSDLPERPGARPKPTFDSDLRFENVRLEYEPGHPVLTDLSVTIRRGERVAFVGATGSGKTSILNLVPRLFDVTDGRVAVDGTDLRDLPLADLRDLISLVPQEPLLFAATIRENILYGRTDANEDELRAAAVAARAAEFVEQLPAGYETEVGDRGVKLSTGQQQRISLARAFLKDAPILLLDEPTSALDLRTEADLLDGIADLMRGRTVLVVAHRLSTVRDVDRIHVVDAGRLVETGTHDQLLARRGVYHQLWSHQSGSAAASRS